MRVGGRPVVVGQRHSNGGSSHRCPGFDSHAVAADFSLSSIFVSYHLSYLVNSQTQNV